ncbi:hypothetical protein QCA50_012931 [Cerrena zonata]|uniref:Uncharacterized protein n=1 Tax=Cerrena zonata TaxID=2478898 RepID=A0AAW0FRM9_9APHY
MARAGAVHGLTAALTAGTFVLEHLWLKDILDLSASSATVTPLTDSPGQYFVRRDRKDRQKKIKIFNNKGVQVYAIERLSALNPVWTLVTIPQRQEVATINAGLVSRSVDFHNKVEAFIWTMVQNILGVGAPSFLEKVINPNGGTEEIRERVAKVKLMRQFKFDFEVLVDEAKIDREIVLATAFVSMLTQWGTGEITDTVGPTYIAPKSEVVKDDEPTVNNDPIDKEETSPIIVVIKNQDDSIEVEAVDEGLTS